MTACCIANVQCDECKRKCKKMTQYIVQLVFLLGTYLNGPIPYMVKGGPFGFSLFSFILYLFLASFGIT
jgi:hypothetical protein